MCHELRVSDQEKSQAWSKTQTEDLQNIVNKLSDYELLCEVFADLRSSVKDE